jgi:hypothetical protein
MKAWSSVISMPGKLFLDHPRSLDETYWQHQHRALRFGISMIVAGVACLIHALVPVLFVRTASMRVQSLYDEMHATRRLGGASHRGRNPLDRKTLAGCRSALQP